jgi:hypothetical protein
MKLTKKQILTLAAFVVLSAGAFSATKISAQEGENKHVMLFQAGKAEHMSSLVQKIADKFGLNKDEVQAVFDEEHKEMEAKMEGKHEERLSQLVTDGKITEDQKALILQKHKELRESMLNDIEEMKDLSPEERRAEMQARHDELKAWADENDIDPKYLMFAMKVSKGHGGMMMARPSSTADETFEIQLH